MKTLRECIAEAEVKKVAIGHFNISDSEGFKAVVEGARELGVPVIIGVSEGEREFIGLQEIVALVKIAQGNGFPVFINADHTYSIEKTKEAIDAGVDSVIIDLADKSFEENVSLTREIVQYANGRVLVEGELGFIGKSSKVLSEVPDGITQTTPEDAKKFVEDSGVDLFAPAVGNVHGIVKTGEPKLNIELIKAIAQSVLVPLVLHGASGNTDEEILQAINAGIRIVHINTELRLAYKEGLKDAVESGEVAPYKFMEAAVEDMRRVVVKKLKVFNKLG
ncbi:MAG: class II fructose-bisphosphate aldolase [bacterium]|nr:class II fructose-bisphosphate aldolase [bacterium]